MSLSIYISSFSGFSRKVTIKNYKRALIVKFHYGKKEQSLIQEQINRGLSFNYWEISLDGERKELKDRFKFKTLFVPMKLYVTLIGPKGCKSECRKSHLCYLPCCLHIFMVAFQKICRTPLLFLKISYMDTKKNS